MYVCMYAFMSITIDHVKVLGECAARSITLGNSNLPLKK